MKAFHSIGACALATFVGASLGCDAPAWTRSGNQVPTTPESEPTDRKMDEITQNVRKLHLGDSPEHVMAIMGAPTYDQTMMKKERQQVIGRYLTYVLSRREQSLLNERTDQYIRFTFNQEGHLTRCKSNNVPGLEGESLQ